MVLICAIIAGLVGLGIGYYLRFIISLGKKGSMELEIKEMLLAAKEEAKKITADAQSKASLTLEETRKEIKEKEEKLEQAESALIKKEDLLDKRQTDIDKEAEIIKARAVEIRQIKERADKLEDDRKKALERAAGLSVERSKGRDNESRGEKHGSRHPRPHTKT